MRQTLAPLGKDSVELKDRVLEVSNIYFFLCTVQVLRCGAQRSISAGLWAHPADFSSTTLLALGIV